MSVFSFLWSFPIFYATFHTKVLKQKVKERVWFGFISFNLQSRFKNVDVWAYCRKSLVADFLKLVLLLNLVVIERRNYGGFKIFMYSLMMIFFFFGQTVLDQTTDLKGMSDLDRKVMHLLCSHLWWWSGHEFALL